MVRMVVLSLLGGSPVTKSTAIWDQGQLRMGKACNGRAGGLWDGSLTGADGSEPQRRGCLGKWKETRTAPLRMSVCCTPGWQASLVRTAEPVISWNQAQTGS